MAFSETKNSRKGYVLKDILIRVVEDAAPYNVNAGFYRNHGVLKGAVAPFADALKGGEVALEWASAIGQGKKAKSLLHTKRAETQVFLPFDCS